jgi:hypothetical protein
MPAPSRPVPKGEDATRWKHTALRKRLATGGWREDGYRALSRVFSKARAEAMGELDMSRNPALSINAQISVSYDEPPAIMAEARDVSGMLGPYVLGLLQRHELYVNALRESLIRLDIEDGKVTARLVTPDEVAYCSGESKSPHVLNKLEELRIRTIPLDVQRADEKTGIKNTEEWTWEVWDWTNPDAPEFRVLSADRKIDRTGVYFPDMKPGDVPYLDSSGRGILPYILYHAETHGGLWDWEKGRELIEGTLRIAVGWTGAHHGFNEASWPQRFGIDVELQGAEIKGEGETRRAEITVSPTSIVMFQGVNGKNGTLSQFEPAIDVKEAGNFLSQCERDLAIWAGLAPSDLVASGDAQSGYSISVSRQGLRRKQAKVQPNLRMGDQLLLATAARLLNAYGDDAEQYPEEPEAYSIVYKGVPLSLEEVKALIDQVEAKRAAGVASRVDVVLALEPGLTREQAKERLVQVAREEAELDVALAPFKKASPIPSKGAGDGANPGDGTGSQDPNNPDTPDDGSGNVPDDDPNNPTT